MELERTSALEEVLARTPARVLVGRAGPALRTATALQLREDHAAARDAVGAEIDLLRDFGPERIERLGLFEVHTQVGSKSEHLRRPDLGRKFDAVSRETIRQHCSGGCDLQVIVGDGLSATAVAAQAPGLLDRLEEASHSQCWSFGRPFLVRLCRVGILNEVGNLLAPEVAVLLIGERPGLATAASLSAYLAYRPRPGHSDADRNLISNIHAAGIGLEEAAQRILALATQLRTAGRSGVGITEPMSTTLPRPSN